MDDIGTGNILLSQVVQYLQMHGSTLPLVCLVQVDRNSYSHRVGAFLGRVRQPSQLPPLRALPIDRGGYCSRCWMPLGTNVPAQNMQKSRRHSSRKWCMTRRSRWQPTAAIWG